MLETLRLLKRSSVNWRLSGDGALVSEGPGACVCLQRVGWLYRVSWAGTNAELIATSMVGARVKTNRGYFLEARREVYAVNLALDIEGYLDFS